MIAIDLILILLSTGTTIRRFLAQVVTGSSLAIRQTDFPRYCPFIAVLGIEVGFHRYSYLFFTGFLPRGP